MRLAVLTSGGDAPGMNACIRAVVRAADVNDFEVLAIRRGYQGVFDDDIMPLTRGDIIDTVHMGGTTLGTARCADMYEDDGPARAVEVLSRHGVDALIAIGGDGTFRGCEAIERAGGPPTIGVPGTIDNDIAGTETTIGFDTAVNTALDAIDRLRDTARSHGIIHIVRVMGRHCGALALAAAIAGGTEAVVLPEDGHPAEGLVEQITAAINHGKQGIIVVVSEGARDSIDGIAADLTLQTGRSHRITVLGHIQRGGRPSAMDRLLGATMGVEAVRAARQGAQGVFIGMQSGALVRVPYSVAAGTQPLDERLTGVRKLLS
ncbi:MAG: ATP-dependent 6-phosphofructokinase [Thermoleophilia bacterium]